MSCRSTRRTASLPASPSSAAKSPPTAASPKPPWPGSPPTTPLPGGDFPRDGYDSLVAEYRARHSFLTEPLARRLVRAYGTRTAALLDGATTLGDLGPAYGAGITRAELAHLRREEFVTRAADVVWRRSRLGLRLSPAEIDRIDNALARL